MCHLKGKDYSDAPVGTRLACVSAFHWIAASATSTTNKAVVTRDSSSTRLRKDGSAVSIRIGRVATRGHPASALLAAVDANTAITAEAARSDHFRQRIGSGIGYRLPACTAHSVA
jgi:hypothetical protein